MRKEIDLLFSKYMAGKASIQEREELLRWIAQDGKLQLWLEERFASFDNEMDMTLKANLLNRIHQQMDQKPRKIVIWPLFQKVAAILLIPLMATVFALLIRPEKPIVQYCTIEARKGQKSNIVLPDGSKVQLNSESKLTYATDFNKKDRQLKLIGEAYFEVAKNKECPFIVKAGNLSVRALGTAFNVRAYQGEQFASATLTEGRVRVSSPTRSIDMSPNEQVDLNTSSQELNITKLDNARKSIGWLNNQLHFNNCTFTEIAASLSRIYNIEIYFSSESIKKQRFSGTINNSSIESVFRILSLSAPIRYELKNGKMELYEVVAEKKYFDR